MAVVWAEKHTLCRNTPGCSWCGQDNTPLWKWLKTFCFPLSFNASMLYLTFQ